MNCRPLPALTAGMFCFLFPLAAQENAGETMQGPAGPAAELVRYERLLGEWAGKGTVHLEPGQPGLAWTMKMSFRKALGGHFYEENGEIKFADESMPLMRGRALYGYDREQKRFVVIGANSFMGVILREIHWGSGEEMIIVSSGVEQGVPYADREVMTVGKDVIQFRVDRSAGAQPTFVHVQGSFERTAAQAPPATPAEAAMAMPAVMPNGELAKLSRMIGNWKIQGTMVPMPGAGEMPISGTESVTLGFDGNILTSHVVGDPSPAMGGGHYEAIGFVGWDAERNCFEYAYADNMGTSGILDGRATSPNEIVYTLATPMMGAPSTTRSITHFTDDPTHPITITSDRLHGGMPAYREFSAKYSPKQ